MEIRAVNQDNLDSYLTMARLAWGLKLTPAAARWRFLEPPDHHIIAGFEQNKCLAGLSAFLKTYLVNGKRTSFLETYDWFTLPEARGSKLGTALRQEMMTWGHAMISLGGSAVTRALLPKIGYQVVDMGGKYGLRLPGYRFQSIPRTMGLSWSAGTMFQAFWALRKLFDRKLRPKGYQWEPSDQPGSQIISLYQQAEGYALYQLPSLDMYRWLAMRPEMTGEYRFIFCHSGKKLLGWFMLRLYRRGGELNAQLIDIFSPTVDSGIYSAMLGQAISQAIALGAVYLGATTTSRVLCRALEQHRFRRTDQVPLMIWGAPEIGSEGQIHLNANRADAPFMPLSSAT